ncbi:Cu(I)-responsive transcriptional regulator [Belnapia rosea]|uniref:Transcriptional regulator, MerR family n=1 Tax=Belnapia rosea TaxID=938405 RepID=A0A1G7BLM1_9PROT|nr:Cu(I)-responsive transcriptional regulator [Belnapia rosea]SDE27994.1 transcriptional regulator, MerR family [Belnapia rosea]
MNIGQASAASGVSAKMLRYYEEIGLLPKAARTGAGYRVYSAKDVNTLRFIRRARDLGLSIERIKLLVGLWQDRERSSADVKRVAIEHVAELDAKILELTAMRETLQELADACHGDHRPDCPILHDLEGGSSSPEHRFTVTKDVHRRKGAAAGLPAECHAG